MRRSAPRATLYRMVMEKHVCPYGLKSRYLLRRHGFEVVDHWLRTREQTDAFKQELGVDSTPQTFIEGRRIGGYDELRRHLGRPPPDPDAPTYRPVIAIFAMAALMALAASFGSVSHAGPVRVVEAFVAFATCLLALQKLRDVESFSTMFLGYDLLARRWVPYAYVYPFAEALVGLLMLARALPWVSVPVALLIGGVGVVSVAYAVYVQKREVKCACVGGGANVPLGFVSLTENLMMVGMGIRMAMS